MRFTAWIVLVATLMLWSGNWIVARAVREEIAPGLATVGRLVIVLANRAFRARRTAAEVARSRGLVDARRARIHRRLHLATAGVGLHYHRDERRSLSLDVADLHPRDGGAARRAHRPWQWTGVAISFGGVYLIAAGPALRCPPSTSAT